MRTAYAALAAAALGAATLSGSAGAADGGAAVETARRLAGEKHEAVVWISTVVTMSGSRIGGERDQKIEATGTIISADGLTVASLAMVDPASLYRMGGENEQMDFKTEFSDVKIRLADGTEVPAKLALKDADLDLAFIVPDAASEEGKKFAGKYPFVALAKGSEAGLLDEVIALTRLGTSMDRQPAVSIGRISAVVRKPRTYYQVTDSGMMSLGTPVFRTDGSALGVALVRKREDTGARSMLESPFTPVVLPAEDVLQISEQVSGGGAGEGGGTP